MRRSIASGLFVTMVLAGCGGDDGKSANDAPSVGYLAAGGAQGVHYETATQSGFTDASGSFRYMPGETVRFSVGGVVLGSAEGANQVTLFTLAGATQPTTEGALRLELDRALRMPTPFLRATNLARFLMAFDADGIPENGLNVTAAGAGLANSSLEFGQRLFEFAIAVESLPQAKNENIPYWRPVVQLYRAQNVAVAVRVPLHAQTRGGSFFFPGADVTYTYRDDGLRESMAQDVTLDGVPEYMYGLTYDAMGRPVTTRLQMGDFFEGIQYIDESTVEYDARGRYLRQDSQTDLSGDGSIDMIRSAEVEGSRADGFQRQTIRHDSDADGDVDIVEVFEVTLDAALRVETVVSRTDEGVDGTIDSSFEQVSSFDARDRIALRTEEYDEDGDGTADYRRVESFTYSDSPSTSRSELSIDSNGDGVADQVTITTRTLDAAGNAVTSVAEHDYEGDGVVDYQAAQTSTYDGERRLLSTVEDQDYTGDGLTDYRVSDSYSYAPFGGQLVYHTEADALADGVIDFRREQRNQYGTGGELLGSATFDLDASPTDPFQWTTVENIGFADGVRALAQSYFEFNAAAVF